MNRDAFAGRFRRLKGGSDRAIFDGLQHLREYSTQFYRVYRYALCSIVVIPCILDLARVWYVVGVYKNSAAMLSGSFASSRGRLHAARSSATHLEFAQTAEHIQTQHGPSSP